MVTSVELPHAPASVGIARRRMVTELTLRGVPGPVVDDAALVLSELVGNAVRHGVPLPGGGVEVSWWCAGAVVHLEVCDGGRGPAGVDVKGGRCESSSVTAQGGRGLAIVSRIAGAWGRELRDGTACVTAELYVPAA